MPTLTTTIPARLDRLPWSRWHWLVVIALGITWILDGLEVTVVGSVGSVLMRPETLGLTESQVGLSASAYLIGAVGGSLFFGYLTDRLGRKKLFLTTLIVYLIATTLTAFSWNFASFACFRVLTGVGIGGEYSAINSTIDELLPARVRGWADLAINGSFWLGCAAGAGASLVLLDPAGIGPRLGWRLAFGMGALLSVAILLVRRNVPESPRWLLGKGRAAEAEAVVLGIEKQVRRATGGAELPTSDRVTVVNTGRGMGLGRAALLILTRYPRRAMFGLVLMAAQAFFYNAIFLTYPLVLTTFFGVPDHRVGSYIFPFAIGNFVGPLLLGRFFDTVGRRRMIGLTYALSGLLLATSATAFVADLLTARTQTLAWSVIFFVASAAASSAYLTVSEIFPLEMRAQAIALFYALGTGVGGAIAPAYFARLIESREAQQLFTGYLVAAALMGIAAVVAVRWGVDAERKPLEEVASL